MTPGVSAHLLALLAAVALPAAALAAPNAGAGDRVAATLDACHADPLQSARFATFGAQMTQIPAGRSMAVRFDLLERDPGSGFRPVAVAAPGFGGWHPSVAGVAILRYSQEVANLPAPAGFRVAASYRWLNARRRVIKRAHRLTPVCVLHDERPNLIAGLITLRRGPDKGTTIYDVAVRNDGRGAAGQFNVALSVSGLALPETTLPGLAPSAGRQVVSFSGPNCLAGSTVTATVDPEGAIDERTKTDDARSITC